MSVPRLLVPLSADSIRRQEQILIPLNLAMLAGVALFHVLFSPLLGRPPAAFFALLLGRFAMQVLELVWLQGAGPAIGERALARYAHFSIWVNLAFAFAISRLGGLVDSHYVVLMLIPIAAAAFRYRPIGIVLVVASAGAATAAQIWLYFRGRGSSDPAEYFEAANVALIYVTVAVVVALLARHLRAEQAELRRNLEELERTRDQLVARERLAAAGRLAGAAAHEVRNPVALIASSLALARRGGAGALPPAELHAILEHEARRLERLTGDFLGYARQKSPERAPTPIATVLGYVADLVRARAGERSVSVTVECRQELVAAVDSYLLQQAVLNLVTNALDAIGDGGQVHLSAETERDELEVAVENDGPAIAEADVPRLFEPFFSRRAEGTGLGLAITANIATAHGGEARLAANSPGRVRFVLRLPVASPSEPATADAVRARPLPEVAWRAS